MILSAVDAKTEYAIIDNLKETRKGQDNHYHQPITSAVVHADLILVLQNGQIIERGTHEDSQPWMAGMPKPTSLSSWKWEEDA